VENQVSTAQFDAWFWVVLLRALRFPPQKKRIKREKERNIKEKKIEKLKEKEKNIRKEN